MAFAPYDGVVLWTGEGRPVRLSPESVEGLLAIFRREGATAPFNALWQAREALRSPTPFTLAGDAARRVVDRLAPPFSEAASATSTYSTMPSTAPRPRL